MTHSFAGALAVSMLFATMASASTPSATDPQAPVAAADKIRCKRYTETGTIAKVHKECHSVAEWQKIAVQGRDNARDMLSRNSGGQTPH